MDQPLPVICDLCRADGLVGAAPFADLADLLSFTPVPRRPHANGWSPEMQRGFIAALVATGSPARAARVIGKHAFGAEQLRRARPRASAYGSRPNRTPPTASTNWPKPGTAFAPA